MGPMLPAVPYSTRMLVYAAALAPYRQVIIGMPFLERTPLLETFSDHSIIVGFHSPDFACVLVMPGHRPRAASV